MTGTTMKSLLLRCCAALLLVGGLFWSQPVRADISCAITMIDNINFGTVDPLSPNPLPVTGTLTFTCRKSSNGTGTAKLCFGFSDGSNPPQMTGINNPGHTLKYQLFTGVPPAGTVWNATNPLAVEFRMTGNTAQSSGSVAVYGQIVGGQTAAAPDSYSDPAARVTTTISFTATGNAPQCGAGVTQTLVTPINVTANISPRCTVIANPMDFGDVFPTGTVAQASSTISVTCASGTPYNVGLMPGNGATTGQGTMRGQISGNTDTVPYLLYQNGNRTAVWGNTVGTNTLTTANGLAPGSGSPQTYTVYGHAPNTNVTPDRYSDTVTVSVTY